MKIKLLLVSALVSVAAQGAFADKFVGSIKQIEATSQFTRLQLKLDEGGFSPEVVIPHTDFAKEAKNKEFDPGTLQDILSVYLSDKEHQSLILKTTPTTYPNGSSQHYAHTIGVVQKKQG